jgi:hypothetical protein
MPETLQYITNEQGDRIGVVLDLDTYSRLTSAESGSSHYPKNSRQIYLNNNKFGKITLVGTSPKQKL